LKKQEHEHEKVENQQRQNMVQSMMAATHRSNQEDNMYDYDEVKEKLRKEKKQEYEEFLVHNVD